MDKYTIFGTKPGFNDKDKNIKNCGAITGIRRSKIKKKHLELSWPIETHAFIK
jgi:hypothetical protein